MVFFGGEWEEELSNGSGVNWLGYEYYSIYGNRDLGSFSCEFDVDIRFELRFWFVLVEKGVDEFLFG